MRLPGIVFLGGKGGVGKTTTAAALGLALAARGRRVMLVSTDPAHSLGDVLDQPLDMQPRPITPGLDALELDPEQALRDYLDQVRRNLQRFAPLELLPEAERQVELAGQHPGALDSAQFEAICRLVDRHREWQHLIFDTAPSGHTLALLALPGQMQRWTEALLHSSGRHQDGPARAADRRWRDLEQTLEERRQLFIRVGEALRDPDRCGFVFVHNDDVLSRRETERGLQRLRGIGVPLPLTLCNRAHTAQPASIATDIPALSVPRVDPAPIGPAALLALGQPLLEAIDTLS